MSHLEHKVTFIWKSAYAIVQWTESGFASVEGNLCPNVVGWESSNEI